VVFYQSNKSYNAGIITGISNRIGDVAIYLTIIIIFYFGDWSFIYMTKTSISINCIVTTIIICAACTKSAQLPFSSWLPAAIAAPTPVSALVHSSTLVTAGIYLLIRFNNILSKVFLSNLMYIGLFTMFIAGISAIFERDIKKIVALSTLSQLGIIIIVLGFYRPVLAYFHLLSHAYFKAILFMGSGIVIHNIKDYQNLRTIRNVRLNILLTNSLMIISKLRLCGIPFMRGFYSKDLILEFRIIRSKNIFLVFIIIISTIITIMYSIRFILSLNINFFKSETIFYIFEKDVFILLGISFLFPFSIMAGSFLRWSLMESQYNIFLPF